MRRARRGVLLIGAVAALLAGAVAESASAVVPGKTVRSADGRLIVKIPRGAMRENVPIRIRILRPSQVPPELQPKVRRVGRVYEIKPDGLRFLKRVTITRRFPGFDLSDGMPGIWLVSRSARGRVTFLGAQRVTRVGGTVVVRGTTRHLSSFGAYDSGVRAEMTPDFVDVAVGESWTANLEVTEQQPGLSVDASIIWEGTGAVGDGTPARAPAVSRESVFHCKAAGDGSFDAHVTVKEEGNAHWAFFGSLFYPNSSLKSHYFTVHGDAICRAAPPACAEPPKVALTTYEGEAHMQFTANCPGLVNQGADNALVDAPPATLVTGFHAHSTSCMYGAGAVSVTCKIKPDGRICMILRFDPPVAAGTTIRVRLRKADFTVLLDQTLTVGANGEASCSVVP